MHLCVAHGNLRIGFHAPLSCTATAEHHARHQPLSGAIVEDEHGALVVLRRKLAHGALCAQALFKQQLHEDDEVIASAASEENAKV